jgi:hypothetical protein
MTIHAIGILSGIIIHIDFQWVFMIPGCGIMIITGVHNGMVIMEHIHITLWLITVHTILTHFILISHIIMEAIMDMADIIIIMAVT